MYQLPRSLICLRQQSNYSPYAPYSEKRPTFTKSPINQAGWRVGIKTFSPGSILVLISSMAGISGKYWRSLEQMAVCAVCKINYCCKHWPAINLSATREQHMQSSATKTLNSPISGWIAVNIIFSVSLQCILALKKVYGKPIMQTITFVVHLSSLDSISSV